jgi:hypothetical protein
MKFIYKNIKSFFNTEYKRDEISFVSSVDPSLFSKPVGTTIFRFLKNILAGVAKITTFSASFKITNYGTF